MMLGAELIRTWSRRRDPGAATADLYGLAVSAIAGAATSDPSAESGTKRT